MREIALLYNTPLPLCLRWRMASKVSHDGSLQQKQAEVTGKKADLFHTKTYQSGNKYTIVSSI